MYWDPSIILEVVLDDIWNEYYKRFGIIVLCFEKI